MLLNQLSAHLGTEIQSLLTKEQHFRIKIRLYKLSLATNRRDSMFAIEIHKKLSIQNNNMMSV